MQTLIDRLYKHKLESLLRQLKTSVERCVHCGAMFSLAERSKLVCMGSGSSTGTRCGGVAVCFAVVVPVFL